MTKKEKTQIEIALKKLTGDEENGGSFTEGIDILCQLLGRRYQPFLAMKKHDGHISMAEFIQRATKTE